MKIALLSALLVAVGSIDVPMVCAISVAASSPSSILQTVLPYSEADAIAAKHSDGITATGVVSWMRRHWVPELGAWARCGPYDNAGCMGPPTCNEPIPSLEEYMHPPVVFQSFERTLNARDSADAFRAGVSTVLEYRQQLAAASFLDSVDWLADQTREERSRAAAVAEPVLDGLQLGGWTERALYQWLYVTHKADARAAAEVGLSVEWYQVRQASRYAMTIGAPVSAQGLVDGQGVLSWFDGRLVADARKCLRDIRPSWLTASCMQVWQWGLCSQSFMSVDGYCGLTCNRCAESGLTDSYRKCVSVTEPTGIRALDQVHFSFQGRLDNGELLQPLPARDSTLSAWSLLRQQGSSPWLTSGTRSVLRYRGREVYEMTGEMRGVYTRIGDVTYGQVEAAGVPGSATSPDTLLPLSITTGSQCRTREGAALCPALTFDTDGDRDTVTGLIKYRIQSGCNAEGDVGSHACTVACAVGFESSSDVQSVVAKCAGADRIAQEQSIGPSVWGAPWAGLGFTPATTGLRTYHQDLQCRPVATPTSPDCVDTRPAWLTTASCATVAQWRLCAMEFIAGHGHCRRSCGTCR